MKQRLVVLPITAIVAMCREYAGKVGFPQDARPVKWQLDVANKKLVLIVESDQLTAGEAQVEQIKFATVPSHIVGGVA